MHNRLLSIQAHDDFLLNLTSHSYSMCRHFAGNYMCSYKNKLTGQQFYTVITSCLSINEGLKKVVLQKTLQMLFMKQHFNVDLLELIQSRIGPRDVLKGQC